MSEQMERGGGLTEKQIRWCRTNLPSFDFAWRQVKQADEHAAKVKRDLEKAA